MISMRNWLAILFSAVVCLSAVSGAKADPPRDGVFVHVTAGRENPHRVLMALQMAHIMSEEHDVLVYFDINGIEAVLKDADDLQYAHFPKLREQLAALPKKGVTLMACPGCLKAAQKTPDDLAAGVKVADKKAFFSLTKGRILTLDY